MKIVILLINCCYLFSTKEDELDKLYFDLNEKMKDVNEMIKDKDQKYGIEIRKVKKEIDLLEKYLRDLKYIVDYRALCRTKTQLENTNRDLNRYNDRTLNSEAQIEMDTLINRRIREVKKIKNFEEKLLNIKLWSTKLDQLKNLFYDLNDKIFTLSREISQNESNLYTIHQSGPLYTPDQSHEIKRLNILIAQKKHESTSLECEKLKNKLDLINFEIQFFQEILNEIVMDYNKFRGDELSYFSNAIDNRKSDKEKIESNIQRCNSQIELFKSQENEAKALVLKYKPLNIQYKFD